MATKEEKQEAIDRLRKMLPPGSTVHTILRHVSPSGMTRWIDLYYIESGTTHYLSGLAARACGFTYDRKRECVKIGGCGMDMGFALVYDLSAVLYHNHFTCIGDDCPSNDHSNGDRDRTPHAHSDGGYALKHRWI